MKVRRALILLVTFLAVTAFGRLVQFIEFRRLIADSKLVFVGRVKSVEPSGITTGLTSWKNVVFEWLRVEVEVLEPIKGTKTGEIISTAMLSLDENTIPIQGLWCPPSMVGPKKDEAFLFCLIPTNKTNLYAALTAPYDEDEAIFRLDRSSSEYSSYRDGKESKDSPFYERHNVIWSLVNDNGQITPSGVELIRKTYSKEISTELSNAVIYLQWKTYTHPDGWSTDVPK